MNQRSYVLSGLAIAFTAFFFMIYREKLLGSIHVYTGAGVAIAVIVNALNIRIIL
jgi:hypothetical protein